MLDNLMVKFLVLVACRLHQKTVLTYLAKFEYGAYLFYQRKANELFSDKESSLGDNSYDEIGKCLEAIAKSEYNHYSDFVVQLGMELPFSYEEIRSRDFLATWSIKLGEKVDSISTKWLSLRYFFGGCNAKNIPLEESICFIFIIEEFQALFYSELARSSATVEAITRIADDELHNSNTLLKYIPLKLISKWNSRKLITYLLIPLDLILEYFRVQWKEVLAEMNDVYFR